MERSRERIPKPTKYPERFVQMNGDEKENISAGKERKMDLLKQKLAKYNYSKPFGADSVDLIEVMLGNLVQATENLNGMKQKYNMKADEAAMYKSEADPLKRENRRLIRENNALHLQIIKEAEEHKDINRRLELELRRIKDENKEVRFVASQYQHKLRQLEKENEKMKKRTTKILQDGTTVKLLSGKEVTAPSEAKQGMEISSSLSAGDVATNGTEYPSGITGQIANIPESLQTRVHDLEEQIRLAESEAVQLKEEQTILEDRINSRNQEIERLSSELARGTNMETAKLRTQCANQEGQISDLKQQLDYLYGQLADFEGDLVSRDDMVTRVKETDRENLALKAKIKSEVTSKERLCRELLELKFSIQQLQRSDSAKRIQKGKDTNESIEKVTRERDTLRKQLDSFSQPTPSRETSSAKSVEILSLREQIKALEIERDTLRDRMKQIDSDSNRLQKETSSLKTDRDVVREALLRSDQNHKADQTTISNLRTELDGTKVAMQRHIDDGKSLAERCGRLEEENERLNSQLTTERRLNAASKHSNLSSSVNMNSKAPTRQIVRSLEEEKEFLKKECSKLQELARKERQKCIGLEEHLSKIEMDLAKASAELQTLRKKHGENLDNLSEKDATILKLQSEIGNLQREVSEMSTLKTKHNMMVNQTQERTSELINCDAELHQTIRELESVKRKAEALEKDKDALNKVISDVCSERDTMAEMVRNFEQHVDNIQNRVVSLGRDRNDVNTKLKYAEDELSKYEVLDREARMEIERLSSQVRKFEQEVDSLTRESQFHKSDADKIRVVAEELREKLADVRTRRATAAEEEARYHIEAKSAQDERDAVRNQLKMVTEQKDELREIMKNLSDEKDSSRREAKELGQQIDQLKTLIGQLGRAREAEAGKARNHEDQVAQLKRSIEELESAIMAGLSREEELKLTVDGHKNALHRLSSEKDAIQEESDSKVEIVNSYQMALNQAEEATRRSEAALEVATKQLELQLDQLNEKDNALKQLGDTVHKSEENMKSMSEELAFKSSVLEELTNDLNNMTKENQAINRELASVVAERDAFAQELQEHVQRVLYIEEMVKSKEREKIEILNSFRSLSEDHARVSQSAENVESEKTKLELFLREQENQSRLLQQRIQETEMQNSRYRSDLESLELHTQKLSHSLAQASDNLSETREKADQLEGDLAATRNVYANAEQSRQNLTRQMYIEGTEKQQLAGELEEINARNAVLENSLEAERQRGAQLESLLLEERGRTGRAVQIERDTSMASQSSLHRLQTDVKRLQEHTNVLEGQLSESTAIRGELAGETAALRRELNKATARLRELELGTSKEYKKKAHTFESASLQAKKIKEYEKERNQLKDFITRYEKELDKAERKLKDLEALYRKKEDQYDRLSNSQRAKEEEMISLREQLHSLREEYRAMMSDSDVGGTRVRLLPGENENSFGAESPISGSSLTSSSGMEDEFEAANERVEVEGQTSGQDPALVLVINEEEEPSVL